MDTLDHKKPTISTGHEVYLCHRCGWPFPNSHPSSRHRRAHKRVCGTIEGFEIFESNSNQLAVSDDEHNSGDDEKTPSPKVEQRIAKELGSSGGVGGKSNKSEEDVFSDAISEFSDSGMSPRVEERLERVKGMEKIIERKTVESDLNNGIELKKADEAADRMEQLNVLTNSEQVCNPATLENATHPSESAISITDARAEPVSVEDSSALQPNLIKPEIPFDVNADRINENGDKEIQQGMVETGEDTDTQWEEDKLASVVLDSEEEKTPDPASVAVEEKDVMCDNLASEGVKHNPSPPTETLENLDAVAEAEGGAKLAEVNESTRSIDPITVAEGTCENINALVGVTEDSSSTEGVEHTGSIDENSLAEKSYSSLSSDKPGGSVQDDSTETEGPDVVSVASSINKEIEQKTSLSGGENAGNFNLNEAEKCDIAGSENGSQELEKKTSGEIVCAGTSYAPETDQPTGALKEDENQNDEKVNGPLLNDGNEMVEGAATGAQEIVDSVLQSVNSTGVPISCEVDSDAKHLEEEPKTEAGLLESGDNGFQKPLQGLGPDTDTKVLQEVGSVGKGASLNHNTIDILDKNLPTTTLEDPIALPVNSELPHNIHVPTDLKEVESVDISGIVSEVKHNGDIIAPERTSENPISKELTPLFADSEILSENSGNENTGTGVGITASESVVAAEMDIELNNDANVVVLSENSENPTVKMREASPLNLECLKETPPHVDEGHKSEDVTTSKSVEIASNGEETCDAKVVPSEKRSDAPLLNEPVPSPVLQVVDESSATGNDVSVDSKPLQDEGDVKLTKEKDGPPAMDLSGSCVSRSDSLEGKCGSVSDKSETNLQAPKITTEEAFEAPSFMTLVQSDGKVDNKATAASEIETVQNNHPRKTELQPGWFPSLTNVVNESEGRKKNEELIAKVTNWNQGKQHGPLKNLLNEAKSPNTKQIPPANQKNEAVLKDNGAAVTTVSSVLGNEATNKEAEKEWDSPARYPTEIKKEKKKGKPYWVPFVCCSSVHRDL